MPARRRSALVLATMVLLSCDEGPTEPNALEIRFQELMSAPAIEVSPAIDSAFREALHPYVPPMPLGLRVYRSDSAWASDWHRYYDSTDAWYRPPPAVDFENHFVLGATTFSNDSWYRIEKLARVRDTTFLVISYFSICASGLQGIWYDTKLRVFPLAPGPSRYAIAHHITDCRSGRTRIEYPPS